MTPEQYAKLPKWAQGHIEMIERERDAVVRTLQGWEDEQTPSGLWYEDRDGAKPPGPTSRRRYVQSNSIEGHHEGVWFRLLLRDGEGIDIGYGARQYGSGDVILQPRSTQQFRLFSVDKAIS